MSEPIKPATEPATCEWCQRYVTRHMDAYYYGFTATGVREIDNVLCSVASAGKGCHSTEDWSDHGYPEMIQKAADKAAALLRERDEQIARLTEALKPFASGSWGSIKAWIVNGAPEREHGLRAAAQLTEFNCAADDALALRKGGLT